MNPEKWSAPLRRAGRATLELVAHFAVIAVALFLMRLLELELGRLWRGQHRRLVGLIPVEYLFDVADLVLLAAFLWVGIRSAVKAYRGSE